jgi:hypothetical protein
MANILCFLAFRFWTVVGRDMLLDRRGVEELGEEGIKSRKREEGRRWRYERRETRFWSDETLISRRLQFFFKRKL